MLQSQVDILEQQFIGPCEVLPIDILSMLVLDPATLKNSHSIKVVPVIEEISNFLNVVFHLWNGVTAGILDLIAHRIQLTLCNTTSILSLTTTHLNNHEHIMQIEGLHLLVDQLRLFLPITNKREEVGFIETRLFGLKDVI